jgi:hypothetical protein
MPNDLFVSFRAFCGKYLFASIPVKNRLNPALRAGAPPSEAAR